MEKELDHTQSGAFELLPRQLNYKAILDNSMVAFFLTKTDGTILEANKAACELFGYTEAELKQIGRQGIIEHPENRMDEKLAERKANGHATGELTGIKKNGQRFPVEFSSILFVNVAGEEFTSTTVSDISERKQEETKLITAKRLYCFTSQVNQLIVRTKDEATLFKEVCRIAVDIGQFSMAWVGLIDEATQTVVPVVHVGKEEGYLSEIKPISVADQPEGRGPTGTALRQGKSNFSNDIATDPHMAMWKEIALSRGYHSSIALPIKKFGKVVGAYSLYAPLVHFFNPVEIQLLEETAADISFALEVLENEQLKQKAEAEVLEVYKEKETTLNRISDSVISLDNEWRYTFLNDEALATHPLGKNETLGKVIWDIHPQMKSTIFWDKYHEAVTTGKVVEIESFYAPMNTWFAAKVYPSADGLTIFYRDISAQKLAEAKMVENEKRLRKAQEIGKMGYWQLNLETNMVWASREAMNIYGFTPQDGELEKEAITACIIDRDKVKEAIENLLEHNTPYNIEIRINPADGGSMKYISAVAEIERNETGEPVKVVGTLQDITERIKAQNEIIKEKNLSDTIINSLPGIFYLYNENGKFLRWNKNFEEVSLYTADEIVQMHPLDFFSDEEKELLTQKIASTLSNGADAVQANFVLKTKEKIPYYFTGKAIVYEGNTCLLGVGIDFSERVKAQEEIKQTADKLSQLTAHLISIREEERKRISREIHDDLGQQLTAINMDVAWIDKKTPGASEQVKSKLKNIRHLLDGTNVSIRRILSELRPVVLENYGLTDALLWLGKQFTEATGVEVKFTIGEPAIIKTSEQVANCIFRAYQEALTNITRYAKATTVAASISMVNDHIVMEITDDGVGFDQEKVKQENSFGLLGMKERVQSLGGTFTLFSSPGKGTKVSIQLPVNAATNAQQLTL